jgi:hypothetical protein
MGTFLIDKKLRTFTTRLLGIITMLLMLSTAYLYFYYADNRPVVPEEKVGRIYPLNVHGRIVYLARKEQVELYALEGATVGCILGFVIAGQTRQKRLS